MATKNAINSADPVEVAAGGTGAATLTDHGVLVGSGTSAVTALTVGGTGELLVGAAGADPAFGSSANAHFTFGGANSGATRFFNVENTSNTANSSARIKVEVGGSSAGDPFIQFEVDGATAMTMGLDNNDSDALKIDAGGIGADTLFKCTTSGEITKPKQPAFLAYLGTTDSNATGDGTSFTLGSGNALTEVFDQNSDFNTNGTFTAPVTGRYMFTSSARLDDVTTSHTTSYTQINTSNGTYTQLMFDAGAVTISGDIVIQPAMAFVDMDAADTADIQIVVSGSTKTVDVIALGRATFFAGYLVC